MDRFNPSYAHTLASSRLSLGPMMPQDNPFRWLSTLGAGLPLHHPLHPAKSALSLDHLTGGFFIPGLGLEN